MPGRPGRRGQRMANVTVTLPVNMLDRLDDLIEKSKLASRSQAVRTALERYLKSLESHDRHETNNE
jgi:metal-responsive CopG/Arc/MetJ family transcriptional regulator